MDKEDMTILAKIVKDTVRIREESYDKKASAKARECYDDDGIHCYADYNKFYTKDLIQSAHEAIKIHAPELDGINYKLNEIIPGPGEKETNLFAHFVYLAIELGWNDVLEWADYVISQD